METNNKILGNQLVVMSRDNLDGDRGLHHLSHTLLLGCNLPHTFCVYPCPMSLNSCLHGRKIR